MLTHPWFLTEEFATIWREPPPPPIPTAPNRNYAVQKYVNSDHNTIILTSTASI